LLLFFWGFGVLGRVTIFAITSQPRDVPSPEARARKSERTGYPMKCLLPTFTVEKWGVSSPQLFKKDILGSN
jgi:hypothetical protein